jgi:hypothetical protein
MGRLSQIEMYSRFMTRVRRSVISASSMGRAAHWPVGELRPLSQSRTVLGLAPVAAAISRSLRCATSRTREPLRVNADREPAQGSLTIPSRFRGHQAAVFVVVSTNRQPTATRGRSKPRLPDGPNAKRASVQAFHHRPSPARTQDLLRAPRRSPVEEGAVCRPFRCSRDSNPGPSASQRTRSRARERCRVAGLSKRLMGLEPTTFCMASRRSSQLSYSRARRGSIAASPRR